MSSNGSLNGFSSEDLRAVVRAVLRDVLPADALQRLASEQSSPGERVVVADDADLDALVRRVAALCEDPSRRAALREGRHGFRLAASGRRDTVGRADAAGRSDAGGRARRDARRDAAGVVRIERGAVTERVVARAAADGSRLVVGRRAVVTPLARDKARVMGVQIEKER